MKWVILGFTMFILLVWCVQAYSSEADRLQVWATVCDFVDAWCRGDMETLIHIVVPNTSLAKALVSNPEVLQNLAFMRSLTKSLSNKVSLSFTPILRDIHVFDGVSICNTAGFIMYGSTEDLEVVSADINYLLIKHDGRWRVLSIDLNMPEGLQEGKPSGPQQVPTRKPLTYYRALVVLEKYFSCYRLWKPDDETMRSCIHPESPLWQGYDTPYGTCRWWELALCLQDSEYGYVQRPEVKLEVSHFAEEGEYIAVGLKSITLNGDPLFSGKDRGVILVVRLKQHGRRWLIYDAQYVRSSEREGKAGSCQRA